METIAHGFSLTAEVGCINIPIVERRVKKMRRLFAGVVVLSFFAALLLTPTARAGRQTVGGSVYPASPFPLYYEEILVGDTLIIKAGWLFTQTGTSVGSVAVDQTITVELDTGKMEGYDETSFTGTIAGESGSYIGFNEWTAVDGLAIGTWEYISGEVGSASLEGEGTFVTDMVSGFGTYSGYIEFNE